MALSINAHCESINHAEEIFRQSLLLALRDDNMYAYYPRSSTRPPLAWRDDIQSSDTPELGHPQVWLVGDAVHAMLSARGQGGNQAMHDCADLLDSLLPIAAQYSQGDFHAKTDLMAAVKEYEAKMIPRAFTWVKASGGIGGALPDPSGWKGMIGIFMANRVLDVLEVYRTTRGLLGYKSE